MHLLQALLIENWLKFRQDKTILGGPSLNSLKTLRANKLETATVQGSLACLTPS